MLASLRPSRRRDCNAALAPKRKGPASPSRPHGGGWIETRRSRPRATPPTVPPALTAEGGLKPVVEEERRILGLVPPALTAGGGLKPCCIRAAPALRGPSRPHGGRWIETSPGRSAGGRPAGPSRPHGRALTAGGGLKPRSERRLGLPRGSSRLPGGRRVETTLTSRSTRRPAVPPAPHGGR